MKWMKSIQRYVNTHDVHAMIVLPDEINRVISIGVDANLFVDNPRKKASLIAYPPFQWGSNVSLASQSKILCLRHDRSIEVWKLGDNQAPKSNLDDIMDCDNALKVGVISEYIFNLIPFWNEMFNITSVNFSLFKLLKFAATSFWMINLLKSLVNWPKGKLVQRRQISNIEKWKKLREVISPIYLRMGPNKKYPLTIPPP